MAVSQGRPLVGGFSEESYKKARSAASKAHSISMASAAPMVMEACSMELSAPAIQMLGRRSRAPSQATQFLAAPVAIMARAAPVVGPGAPVRASDHTLFRAEPICDLAGERFESLSTSITPKMAKLTALAASQASDAFMPPINTGNAKGDSALVDFTMMPKMLDAAIEEHDTDNALRSTIIKTSDTWTRSRQENLLTKIRSSTLRSSDIKSEKDKAFDLLDALSRSGSLPISCSELHVIISVTHCFEKDVMGTVIQDNINPIEKLEMSTLLIASTLHGVPAGQLVRDDSDRRRLTASFPKLLERASTDGDTSMSVEEDAYIAE
jgi:hypothetical protein